MTVHFLDQLIQKINTINLNFDYSKIMNKIGSDSLKNAVNSHFSEAVARYFRNLFLLQKREQQSMRQQEYSQFIIC